MRKSSMLIVAMVMACFVIMAVNSNSVMAGNKGNKGGVPEKLDTIEETSDNQVIPLLETCCGGVPKTGQTTSYATGDDGDLEKGTPWPVPRFTENEDDTVTDNLTGLMWLKDADCISTEYPGFDNDGTAGDGKVTWQHALDFVAGINDGICPNCGAGHDDWRVPNVKELQSLFHYGVYDPALPNTAGTGNWSEGDPFSNVQSLLEDLPLFYWSSTIWAGNPSYMWHVCFHNGGLYTGRSYKNYVWPVRDN